jgi:hypothetical protein
MSITLKPKLASKVLFMALEGASCVYADNYRFFWVGAHLGKEFPNITIRILH